GNALQTRYIHGDVEDQLLARESGSGTVAWYETDRLGSVIGLVNASGTAIATTTYDGFGNVVIDTSPTNRGSLGFTGRPTDSETGQQYNRRRYYGAPTGRWTGQDPLACDDGDQHRYPYPFPRCFSSATARSGAPPP